MTGQTPPPPAAPALTVPAAVAPGGRLRLVPRGLTRPVRIQVRRGSVWRPIGPNVTVAGGAAALRAQHTLGRERFRAEGADGAVSPSAYVRVRPLTLMAVGDINLGDGPGGMIDRFGGAYPWASVGATLRSADIAFGNLECAITTGGTAQVKEFTFRGRPSSVTAMRKASGMDVVTLANNHSGDFGKGALLDTLRSVRAAGILPIGAGANEAAAYRPRIVERLGLKVAFVGFVNILPFEFRAIGDSPGSAWAFPGQVRTAIEQAKREADVVIAAFHWGIERDTTENAEQRSLAQLALDSGATAVIGAHPHVLQPVRRVGHKLIAYSLGNFVFGANSPGTASTGILKVQLGSDGVLGDGFVPASIAADRPILRG